MKQYLVTLEMPVQADDPDSARNIGWETLDCGAMLSGRKPVGNL